MEYLTVATAQQGYREGHFTCRDLVTYYLDRVNKFDKSGPKLNAALAISTSALYEADELDHYLKTQGQLKGALHGIPIAVKDQAATANLTTTYGSVAAKDHVPMEDATLVKKLKEAGAIILLKTTMPDWATSWFSTSSLSGTTCNPYDPRRDPGGSSSGTGAAIAADFALLGLGEDTGGSIRLPSAFCGLVGLRPTPGMISRAGMSPLVVPQDTPGPMCRTVRDTALMFDAMVGFDENDNYTTTNIIGQSPQGASYAVSLDGSQLSNLRIGIVGELFGSDDDADCVSVNKVVKEAMKAIEEGGATLVEVKIPDLLRYFSETFLYALRSRPALDNFFATHTDPAISELTVAKLYDSKTFHPALDLFEAIANGPASPYAAGGDYARKMESQAEFQRVVLAVMAKANVSLLAFPVCRIAAPLTKDIFDHRWTAAEFPTNTLLASQAILPSISVPVGLTQDQGLPVGLELVGAPYGEQRLLEAAFCVEQLVGTIEHPHL